MIAAQEHAHKAGEALSRLSLTRSEKPAPEPTTFRVKSAKVGIGNHRGTVSISSDVYRRIRNPVEVKFDWTTEPGKLTVLVSHNPVGTLNFSPFRGGTYMAQINTPKGIPPFGVVAADSVYMKSDGILRIVLPGKRPPVGKANRVSLVKPKQAVAAAETPKPEPVNKSPEAQAEVVPEAQTVPVDNVRVSCSPSGARLHTNPSLEELLGGKRWGITSWRQEGEEFVMTLGHGNYRLGKPTPSQHRYLTLQTTPSEMPLFRSTGVTSLRVLPDKSLELRLPASLGTEKLPRRQSTMSAITITAPAPEPVVAPAPALPESSFARIKRLRDEVNECILQAKEEGDVIVLRIKEDKLSFVYEG